MTRAYGATPGWATGAAAIGFDGGQKENKF